MDDGKIYDDLCRTTLCDEPLRLALRNRHVEVARVLLEAGANPNKRYFFGSEINLVSPLDLQCMELLLAFGAQPNTRDRAGLTPLMKAARLPQVNDRDDENREQYLLDENVVFVSGYSFGAASAELWS